MQRVIITAGAAGIGRATARRFVKDGAKVAVCDVDHDALAKLKVELPTVSTHICDVSNEAQVGTFMADAMANVGGVDVLVNNAGTAGPTGNIEDLSLADFQACLAVNVLGGFMATRAAVPAMKAQGHGAIINLSSAAGIFPFPQRTPYSASKWGIVGVTKSLALELGPSGIRVNCICPGAVNGDRIQRVFAAKAEATGQTVEQVQEKITSLTGMRTMVDNEDIAEAIFFLASPAARFISGQALPVDGAVISLAS